MHKDERLVYFYEVEIEVLNVMGLRGLRPPALQQVLEYVKRLVDSGKAQRERDAAGETIYIPEIEIDTANSTATLLINVSDRNAADVIYSNPKEKAREEHRKKEGHGNESSSHVVFSLTPITGNPNKYRMVVERAPALTGATISNHLSFLLKQCSMLYSDEFYLEHPDGSLDKKGNVKLFKFWYRIKPHGLMSDMLKAQLENGYISDIDLITESVRMHFDDGAYAKPTRSVIRLRPEVIEKLGTWDRLVSIFKTAKENNYEKAKIVFKTDDDVEQSAVFDTDTESLLSEDKYTKRKTISGFTQPLDNSTLTIDQERKNKMIGLLNT